MSEFFDFWKDLFFKPRVFFEKHFANGKNDNRYFMFALIVCGTGYGIDRLDRQLTQHELKGTLDSVGFINTWPGYWIIAVIGGTIGGYISYLIGGWFYNVRLKWCKGDDDPDTSKSLFLYSTFVNLLPLVLLTLVTTFVQNKPYVSNDSFSVLNAVTLIVVMFAMYYSIYVSFAGVTTVTNANWTRAVIWFMVAPAVLYTLLYIAVIGLLYAYFINRG